MLDFSVFVVMSSSEGPSLDFLVSSKWGWSAGLICLLSLLLSASIGAGPHSGEGSPPMYGDFEAQRHWLEITVNLSPGEWYVHSAKNDLQYWGLDYPPLTAYHSWVLGKIALWVEPKWVEFGASRGEESYEAKIFMRLAAIVSDVAVFYSGTWFFLSSVPSPPLSRLACLSSLLLFPGRLLIDHGHFQFNSVALGLLLWSLGFLLRGKDFKSAVCFVLALGYKQTMLYYAPAIFFVMLGRAASLYHSSSPPSYLPVFMRVAALGGVVLSTLLLLLLPLPPSSYPHVLSRVFPFNRGLYEDHVGNLWVLLSPLIKAKQWASEDNEAAGRMMKLASFSTLLLFLPGCWNLCRGGQKGGGREGVKVLLGFSSVSFSFFLASWQVHEKAILLPLLPLLCLPLFLREKTGKREENGGNYSEILEKSGKIDSFDFRNPNFLFPFLSLSSQISFLILWTLLEKDGQLFNGFLSTFIFLGFLDFFKNSKNIEKVSALPRVGMFLFFSEIFNENEKNSKFFVIFHKIIGIFWDFSGILVLFLSFFSSPPPSYPFLFSYFLNSHACIGVIFLYYLVWRGMGEGEEGEKEKEKEM